MLTTEGVWKFVTEPAVLVLVVTTLALAWPLGRRLADRCRCPRVAAILFVIAVGILAALTLTPNAPTVGVPISRPPHFVHQLRDGHLIWAMLVTPPADDEQLANIAIYLPAGFLGRFVWGTVGRATVVGLALTVFVEICQYGVIGRVGSITDIRNNALGAFLGAIFAAAIIRRRQADQTSHRD